MTDRLGLPTEEVSKLSPGGEREFFSAFTPQASDAPLVVPSSLTLSQACTCFRESPCDYLVVQDSEDVIEGVLSKERLYALLRLHEASVNDLEISRFIERNICMEPEFATLQEVIERLEFTDATCALIYNRLGRPILVASLTTLHKLHTDEG